jgi:hypothetical protein
VRMNDLPSELFGCIFHNLDAFDAHRFGMTHHRAFQVINAERELAHNQSQYHRWFDDVDKRMVVLVEATMPSATVTMGTVFKRMWSYIARPAYASPPLE